MPNQSQFLQQDGTSQADRVQKALDPDYVAVDERSVKDLLVFAQKYAKELRYFNEQNQAAGDWSGFLGDDDTNLLDEVVAYLNNPQPNEALSRPHLVLFLTFLELLQVARAQLNDLTRRHLEFYYREALRLTSRKGVPDQVHALVTLSNGQNQYLLPAGTLLRAGQDSLGRDLFYRSNTDLIANQASVERLKSLYSQKMIIGIREARQTPDLLVEMFPANKDLIAQGNLSDRTFMAMLAMALGTPSPGSPLALYPEKRTVNVAFLSDLDALLAFLPANLYMPFSTFRSLMALKLIQNQTGDQWKRVNDIIEAAGKKRDTNFTLDRSQPDNFEKNLLAALGRKTFGTLFNGLAEVDDIYGLNRRRERKDVTEFIQNSLNMSVPDFIIMMDIVEDINARWRQIYEILRLAGRKKERQVKGHKLLPPEIRSYNADKFSALVSRTLGTITYPKIASMTLANFDDCNREIAKLEDYFHVTAEEFVLIRGINQKEAAQPWEWEQVYAILEDAHTEKVIADRRNALKEKHKNQGFEAMILFALGDPNPGDALPNGREDFQKLNSKTDASYLTEKLFIDPTNYDYIQNVQTKGQNASDDEWNNVYNILERAQSRKRGVQTGRAELEKWDNLYAAADATGVQVRLDAQGEVDTPRWRTFGEGYSGDPTRTVPGNIGFAIASPLLALSEGTRTVTLTMSFRAEKFDKASVELALKDKISPFRVLLSSAKGMVEIPNVMPQLLDAQFTVPDAEAPYQHALQITLTLNEQFPAVAPLTISPLIQTPWPVLQIMLADIPQKSSKTNGPLKRYRAFQALSLEKIFLRVDVAGLTSLTLQNDENVLNAKKPFEPFGYSPVVGSSFYMAHPELSVKRLNNLSLNIDWLAAPDDLNAYYVGYKDYADTTTTPTSPIADNTAFKATLKLFDNRSLFTIGDVQLFNAEKVKTSGASLTNRITIDGAVISRNYPAYQRDLNPTIASEVLDWDRYWKLELLSPNFQHGIYSRAATGCAAKTKDGKSTPYTINTPYNPKIKRLSVGYSSSLEIDLTKTNLDPLADRLYHIEPFGYRDLAGHDLNTGPSFLPQYVNEGELFIGIKNLAAPQSLSLLFQLAEGSADPDLAQQDIQWQYLDGNIWKSLEEGKLLSDSTNGLLNSGIIRFDLAAAQPGTLLPPNLYWIRAAISRNSRSVGDTVAIKAQAISATFVDQNNAPDHLAQPLPAESISGLVEPLAAVTSIQQPYSSFGGKIPEQAANFYIRASERLRHKNRALTIWDYEHMVLEAFPSIFKVKCLPVGSSPDPRLADVIQLIVVPDIKGKLPFDPFEPKSPADVLFQIKKYLEKQNAPFAKFEVRNPIYLRLQVRLGVHLRSAANTGYYRNLLNEELQRYLAPWAYDRSAEIVFGGEINSSLIVNFVEERPYVDYVAGITLFITPPGATVPTIYNPNTAPPLPPDAILVSDRSHVIDLIAEEGYEEEFFSGINYMKIELDFQISTQS